jgi:hypothetical protein
MTPLNGINVNGFNPEDRTAVAVSVARTILEDLHGMEEYALWSMNRVLYVPVRETGRVCVETRVPRGADWASGYRQGYTNIQIIHRIIRADCDTIHHVRDVRLRGTVESITRRVRKAVIEGMGSLSAIAP